MSADDRDWFDHMESQARWVARACFVLVVTTIILIAMFA
jgi:hypothetical protein